MSIQEIKNALRKSFQGVLKNIVSLANDSTLESDLKVLKVGEENTKIQLSKTETKLSGKLTIHSDSDINIKTSEGINLSSTNDIVLSGTGDIVLNSDGGTVTIKDDTASHFLFDCDNTRFRIYDDTDANHYFTLGVDTNGATTLGTSNPGTTAHMTLVPDGDLILDPASNKIIINATDDLYFDGGGDTYITENSADSLQFTVGGDLLMSMIESGAGGNAIVFTSGSNVAFVRQEATFSATGIIGSGGADDTDIDFRVGNKYRLEMTSDIATMNLIFPLGSGNYVLVCTTNGDHDVSAWKVFDGVAEAATTTDVMWAGGSVPAFTSSGVDIVSFYWDANEGQCYGVASLAFATP